jgi:hypothetical protein
MRSDGSSTVDMQVRLNDGTEVEIRVQLRDGHVEPTFKTDSEPLRQAIEQNWQQFTSESAQRGMRVTTPAFESPALTGGTYDSSHDQQQDRRQSFSDSWGDDSTAVPWNARQQTGASRDNGANGRRARQAKASLEIYA